MRLLLILLLISGGFARAADEPPSAVGPVMKLLQSGRVPEARLPAIVEIVGTRGNEHDLKFLLSQAVETSWPPALRATAFRLLTEAARTRKVVPAGDLAGVGAAISSGDAAIQLEAVRFAGAARASSAAGALSEIVASDKASPPLKAAALEALVGVAGKEALPSIEKVLSGGSDASVQAMALAAMAELDLAKAAAASVGILNAMKATDDAGPILDAFLARKTGAETLARALSGAPPSADVAKLALRHMYAIGRSDEALVAVLGKAAGINEDVAPVTPELIAGIVSDVEKTGDAARGETVFRRTDLSCTKCHAVSGGGGQIGPDLSAVGSISPLDYLATSVLNPDQAIKEAYISRVVATADGRVLQGIVVDRNAEKIVLKDATGAVHTIAMADVDDEVEGKSLMPKGLVKFMTRQELADLVKFLSQLGRPGDYAIRTTARFQRYRVLARLPAAIGEEVPNDEQFEAEIARSDAWAPFYARVNGTVPLDEARQIARSPVVYLMTEFDVRTAGNVKLKVSGVHSMQVWLDDDSLDDLRMPFSVEPGRHRVTLRIDTRGGTEHESPQLELVRPEGSKAEFQVVDGA